MRFVSHRFAFWAAVIAVCPWPCDAAEHTFRVRFGLTDAEPTAWDGSARVAGGRLTALRSWRPRRADEIGESSWKLATTPGRKFAYRNWEPEPSAPVPDYLYTPGLILSVEAQGDARVDLETVSGHLSFRLSEQPAGLRRFYLGGAAVVERSANLRSASSPGFHNGFADIAAEPGGSYWVAWIGYRDWANHVFVRRFDGQAFGEIQELTAGPSDAYYVRLARDGYGGVVAVWADQREGNFDLFARMFDGETWSPAERLTTALQPDIHQALATDALGRVWLAWQGFREKRSAILARRWEGGAWSEEERVSQSPADNWHPAIAADARGAVYVAWETYENNDYDIRMRKFAAGAWSAVEAVAATARYEAYPSLVCDAEGRLWAAWNESGTQWGKDTGFLLNRPATQLYQTRRIGVAVYDEGGWKQPQRGFEQSLPEDLRGFNDFPRLRTDRDGRVWALFRHRHLRQREVPHTAASHRAAWETYATAFDGRRWSLPLPLPATAGRSDAGFGFSAAPDGALYTAWATDNRIYDDYLYEQGEVFAARLPALDGPVYEARLQDRPHDELRIFPKHPNEREDVARVRNYVIKSEGRTYRVYRGDTHRHTEYSGDGNNDGAQNDTYRYALDVAELDYLGMSEHHNAGGPNLEYINWLLQQRVDVFHVPGRFVPLYGLRAGRRLPTTGTATYFLPRRGNPDVSGPAEREGVVQRRRRPLRLSQALPRHLDPPHARHRHGHRLARQRPGGRAIGRDLPGGSRVGGIRGCPAGGDGNRRHQPSGRLSPEGLCVERMGQRLQARGPGQLRTTSRRTFRSPAPSRRSSRGRDSSTPCASATTTRRPTTSSSTTGCAPPAGVPPRRYRAGSRRGFRAAREDPGHGSRTAGGRYSRPGLRVHAPKTRGRGGVPLRGQGAPSRRAALLCPRAAGRRTDGLVEPDLGNRPLV